MRSALIMLLALMAPFAMAADTKVAVVDMERALFLTEAAKISIQQFEKDNKTDIDKLKAAQNELMSIREKIEKDGDVLSEDERRKLSSSYEEKGNEYQFFSRKLVQLEQKWKRDFFQEQLPTIEKVMKGIVEEGGYDIVLQAGSVVYMAPSVDLTKVLLDRLNAQK